MLDMPCHITAFLRQMAQYFEYGKGIVVICSRAPSIDPFVYKRLYLSRINFVTEKNLIRYLSIVIFHAL